MDLKTTILIIISILFLSTVVYEYIMINKLTNQISELEKEDKITFNKFQNDTNIIIQYTEKMNNTLQNNINVIGTYISQINSSLSNQIISLQNQIMQMKNTPITVSIWNVNETIPEGHYLFGAMFDTFDNNIRFQTNDSVNVEVLTNKEFANFHFNISYAPTTTYFGTDINFWFNESEGCSGYVYVIYANNFKSFFIKPNITATYNPTPLPTGVCV